MADLATLYQVLDWQARFTRESNSPFSALVFEQIAAGLEPSGPYALAFAPWIGMSARAIFDDAAQLRLLGAFHFLALSGEAPELAALYPPNALPDGERLGLALLEAAKAHPDILASFMASPPQTNEVGRSLCLIGGFLTVAKETGLPLRCLELGASAGLNMNWDRYAYRFGQHGRWGAADALLELSGDWTGGAPPLDAQIEVIERCACDQRPIDVTDPAQALRLRSYVWADQTLRLERLDVAIRIKRQSGGAPERADAAEWSEAHAHPKKGAATVVYHSSFMPYPPPAVQQRIKTALEAAGEAATSDAPFAWLSKEPDPLNLSGPDEVVLRLWTGHRGDGAPRRLALVHPHGAHVQWLA